VIDPRTQAVRGDLADVRLAEIVFAPHYAAPLQCIASRTVTLQSTREAASESLGTVAAGDRFEVLELAGNNAWGVAPAIRLVGYVDRTALEPATE
jgi:hypothetical protein